MLHTAPAQLHTLKLAHADTSTVTTRAISSSPKLNKNGVHATINMNGAHRSARGRPGAALRVAATATPHRPATPIATWARAASGAAASAAAALLLPIGPKTISIAFSICSTRRKRARCRRGPAAGGQKKTKWWFGLIAR